MGADELPAATFGRGLRLVGSLVRLAPGPIAVAVVGAALYSGATVLATVLLGWVTDRLVLPTFAGSPPSDHRLWLGAAGILALAVLKVSGVVCRRFFGSMSAERIRRALRQDLSDRVVGMPLVWYRDNPAGELLALADNDAEVTGEVITPLPFSMGVMFLALFSGISLMMVDQVLAMVAFLIFPALMALNRVYSRRVERPASAVQAGVGKVSAVAHESFDGALIVKSMGRADAEVERFSHAALALRDHRLEVGYLRAGFEAVMDVLPNLGIIAVIIVGTYRIEAGAIRPGQMVQVAALFTVLAFPMRVFGFFLESIPPSLAAERRLAGVLHQPLPGALAGPVGLPEESLGISVSGLRYGHLPGQYVLDEVDLEIGGGEIVALVGSTGAGKSTLATILGGLLPPDEGTVRLAGVDLTTVDPHERTEAIAFVFQESFLFADTLRSNIDIDGRASDDEITDALDRARIRPFVEGLASGLDTIVGERGVTLSGGQRQRVALARALLRRPRVLILDDATSAVDARIEHEILTGLHDRSDVTTIIVAQRVSTIALADRVIYLAQGEILASGTHDELLAHPGYEALVRAYEQAES